MFLQFCLVEYNKKYHAFSSIYFRDPDICILTTRIQRNSSSLLSGRPAIPGAAGDVFSTRTRPYSTSQRVEFGETIREIS
jgi:hypothetical protein